MSKWKLGQLVNLLFGAFGFIFVLSMLVLAIKTLPQSVEPGYPLPPEKNIEETSYPPPSVKTPNITQQYKPPILTSTVSTPAPDQYSSFTRPAEFGIIIETSFSPLRSSYLIVNQWFAEFDNKKVYVLAGTLVSDLTGRGGALPKPWPSVIVIETITTEGEYISEESGLYRTDDNNGWLRIIDANQHEIILVTNNGKKYYFDLKSKTFSAQKSDTPIIRKIGKGAIWETGKIPVFTNEYTFENYWLYEDGVEKMFCQTA